MVLAEVAVEGPLWAQVVYAVVTAIVAAFLIPYLNKKRLESTEKITALAADSANSTAAAGGILLEQLKFFLHERAACIAEKEFPKLAAKVLSGELKTVDQVKSLLRLYGTELKREAIEYFKKHQGLDLIRFIGDQQLDRLIEYAANRVSPFPGKESAVEFLKEDASNWLIDKGIAVVRNMYLDDAVGAPASPAQPSTDPAKPSEG